MDTSGPPSGSMKTGSTGKKTASKALSSSFEDHGIGNMRERIAAKNKKVADEAMKKTSMKENAPSMSKKATADEEGRKLTKCINRALHDCVEEIDCPEQWLISQLQISCRLHCPTTHRTKAGESLQARQAVCSSSQKY